MGKRKRPNDAVVDGAPLAKKQATQGSGSVSAAARRQLRSERKSKKAQQAKENAAKKRSKTHSEPELVKSNTAENEDKLAGGEDFIPLTDAADATHQKNQARDKPQKKSKTASPRSGRSKSQSQPAGNGVDEPNTAQNAKDTPRFICFVGNLPYSCTTEQINHHFRKLEPVSIRHSTDKKTGKSKGFAFLEFDDYSKMKTCLKVYHHSMFDPERTATLPEDAFDEHGLEKDGPEEGKRHTGRKINVELTAGGGGTGAGRKAKIQQKNTKLFEERERRRQSEMKQQKGKEQKKKDEKSEANSLAIGSEAVHPSRLNRVKQ